MNQMTIRVLHALEDLTVASGQGSAREVAEVARCHQTTARRHLAELVEAGFVSTAANGNRPRYAANLHKEPVTLPPPPSRRPRRATATIWHRNDRVLAHLRMVGPRTRVELETDLDLTPDDAYYALLVLRRAGLVERALTGTRTPRWRAL